MQWHYKKIEINLTVMSSRLGKFSDIQIVDSFAYHHVIVDVCEEILDAPCFGICFSVFVHLFICFSTAVENVGNQLLDSQLWDIAWLESSLQSAKLCSLAHVQFESWQKWCNITWCLLALNYGEKVRILEMCMPPAGTPALRSKSLSYTWSS